MFLETRSGSEKLSFPGPGGYEIQWSPGTRHFNLQPAQSGHLMIPCDDFGNIANESVLPDNPMTLHTSPAEQPCGGSSATSS